MRCGGEDAGAQGEARRPVGAVVAEAIPGFTEDVAAGENNHRVKIPAPRWRRQRKISFLFLSFPDWETSEETRAKEEEVEVEVATPIETDAFSF